MRKDNMVLDIIRGGFLLWTDTPICPKLRITKIDKSEKHLHLSYDYWDSKYEEWGNGTDLNVDLEKSTFGGSFASKPRGNSGDIGLAKFTFIPAILLLPIIILIRYYHGLVEKKYGMSHHSYAFLGALKGQLDQDTEAILIEVFQNSWARQKSLTKQVSFEEAQEILKNCRLFEEFAPANSSIEGEPEARGFNWFNEEPWPIANGSFYGERDHYVRVLGSMFEDAQADILVKCYKTKEFRDWSDDKD